MKRSTQRILTTHVGSLPRPPDLLQMIQAKERGEPLDAEAFARRVASAVAEVVRKQAESGIDIVADGEMGRFGFIPYVNERLAGIEPRQERRAAAATGPSRASILAFPEYYQWAAQMPGAAGGAPPTQWVCTGPIAYRGRDALQRDIDNLKAALAEVRLRGSFHAGGVAGQSRQLEHQRVLQDRRGVPDRACRRAARGIPGDRRCRPRPADRRSAAGEPLGDASGDRPRAVPQMGERQCRAVEPRACAASRPSGSAITPATASIWARGCTTSN